MSRVFSLDQVNSHFFCFSRHRRYLNGFSGKADGGVLNFDQCQLGAKRVVILHTPPQGGGVRRHCLKFVPAFFDLL